MILPIELTELLQNSMNVSVVSDNAIQPSYSVTEVSRSARYNQQRKQVMIRHQNSPPRRPLSSTSVPPVITLPPLPCQATRVSTSHFDRWSSQHSCSPPKHRLESSVMPPLRRVWPSLFQGAPEDNFRKVGKQSETKLTETTDLSFELRGHPADVSFSCLSPPRKPIRISQQDAF